MVLQLTISAGINQMVLQLTISAGINQMVLQLTKWHETIR